jgi:hypothetical protein
MSRINGSIIDNHYVFGGPDPLLPEELLFTGKPELRSRWGICLLLVLDNSDNNAI